jgi:hypothetical protein
MSPPLALGQIIHEVLESLTPLPLKDRFTVSLVGKLHEYWKKIEGKRGGFMDNAIEAQYKRRGEEMMLRIMKSPGPLAQLAVKLKMDLPYFWLSEEKNIILCGKIDWMEYMSDIDSVHILDFKTGKKDEEDESLQLPIYYLLAKNCQSRHVAKMSYWYLEREDGIVEKELPAESEVLKQVMDSALEIQLATKLGRFKCKEPDGCYSCKSYEKLIKGEGEFIGMGQYKEDIYILPDSSASYSNESEIL